MESPAQNSYRDLERRRLVIIAMNYSRTTRAAIEHSNRGCGIFTRSENDTCTVPGQLFNPLGFGDCVKVPLKLLPCYIFVQTSNPNLLLGLGFLELDLAAALTLPFPSRWAHCIGINTHCSQLPADRISCCK